MKRLKIKHKLILGMMCMVLIVLILGKVANEMSRSIDTAHDLAIDKANEVAFLKEREVKYLEWSNQLKDLLLFHRSLRGELDYKECDFGKWYYPYLESEQFKNTPDDYKKIILRMGDPHRRIHELAAEIEVKHAVGRLEESKRQYENELMKNQEELRRLLIAAEANMSKQSQDLVKSADSTTNKAELLNIWSIVVAVLLGLGIAAVLVRTIIVPLSQFVERITHMTNREGNYRKIDDIRSDDEIGELVCAFNCLIGKVLEDQVELQQKNEELQVQGEELASQNEEILSQQEELQNTLDKLSRQEGEISRLYGFSQVLTRVIELDELLDTVLTHVMRETGTQVGAISLYDEDTRALSTVVSSGLAQPDQLPRLSLGEGLAGRAALERRIIQANYRGGQLRTQGMRDEIAMAGEVYLPLVFGEKLLGVMALGWSERIDPTREEQKLLAAMADQVAVAIHNARSYYETRQALEQVKGLDRLKSELVNTVSHELRTPLASILGFAELLLKKPVGEAKAKLYLNTIYGEAVRLTNLINNFLDLQRIEAGRLEFDLKPVNLTQLLKANIEIYQAQSAKHSLILKQEEDLPLVLADYERVTQVVGNLLSNALKYSPNGGNIEISAKRRSPTQIEVTVADQGLGIPMEAQKNLFKPFFRVDNSDRREIGGTGLGLAISQKIINAHGGELAVRSAHGQGSAFSFTLPAADGPKRVEDSQFKEKINFNTEAGVLIVEDDKAMADLLAEALKSAGFTSNVVDNGPAALAIAQEQMPAVIILDLILTGPMDGWETLLRLKQDRKISNIPVIISSCIENKKRGMELGAVDYLVKPFAPEKLVNSVVAVTRMAAGGTIGLPKPNELNNEEAIKELLTTKGLQVQKISNRGDLLVITLSNSQLQMGEVT